MALSTLSLLNGGTSSTTGGTAEAYGPSGYPITNGVVVVETGAATLSVQKRVNATVRTPSKNSDGTSSNMKCEATYVVPFTDADGNESFNTARVTISYHPETTSTQRDDLLEKAAQLVIDTDMDSFWNAGSLA